MTRRFSPPQIIIASFLCAIGIGAILLSLPIATQSGERANLIDSIFTATSATCVTGLIVRDTGSYFSGFGQAVILVLLQMGGLGIMTFSTLFAIILGRKITLKQDLVIQTTVGHSTVQNLPTLIKYILFVTLGIEITGAVLLAARWMCAYNWSFSQALMAGFFHSISAFCNAGFSLFSKSFSEYAGDTYINSVMIALIVLGGIGFIAVLEIPRFFKKSPAARVSVQTKLAITVSIILIILGAIVFFFVEQNNSIEGLSAKDKIFASLFQSVTARTAGFNTVSTASLAMPTLCFFMFLMFVGASPGSTGGGIKTCTLGVLVAGTISMLKNRDRVSVFKRTVPKEVVRRAILVVILAIAWIFIAMFFISIAEYKKAPYVSNYFLKLLFEITSAFGTVGLSTGITQSLSVFGKCILIVTMLVGRIGPLTLVLAVALRQGKILCKYPEERIMIG
ncbi:MAG: hypothetical protein ISS91_04305 [Candidatus Omnitrophica bacterium]|nr:hypothetical protein [Candidatus Omnitrophota bacterium]